jgi:hypothetical protein
MKSRVVWCPASLDSLYKHLLLPLLANGHDKGEGVGACHNYWHATPPIGSVPKTNINGWALRSVMNI